MSTTLLCCQPSMYVLDMLVRLCFMFVLIFASSMVLGSVSMSVAQSVLLYAACLLRLAVTCCSVMQRSGRVGWRDFCPICDVCSWRCSLMGSMCVSSCRYCASVSAMHPTATLSAVSCVICSLLTSMSDAIGEHMVKTHPSMGLAMALHAARIVSPCFPHVVDVRALSIYCLACLCCRDFHVFAVCEWSRESVPVFLG